MTNDTTTARFASYTHQLLGWAMTVMNSAMDGARLALVIGISLALVNGVWARFSPSHRTLQRTVNDLVSGGQK